MKNKILVLTIICLSLLSGATCFAQGFEERVTQEEFAADLVKKMKLDNWLPTAALASDCVNLLEKLGISPLKGWDKKAYLTEEDYLVVLTKAYGKEGDVHENAVMVEGRMKDEINDKWQKSYDDLGHWLLIDELMSNEKYFPEGPLNSPYGNKFEDLDGDHLVDQDDPAVVGLMKLKNYIAAYDADLP